MSKIIVPYTNGVDNEVIGYIDLTDLISEVIEEIKNEGDLDNLNK